MSTFNFAELRRTLGVHNGRRIVSAFTERTSDNQAAASATVLRFANVVTAIRARSTSGLLAWARCDLSHAAGVEGCDRESRRVLRAAAPYVARALARVAAREYFAALLCTKKQVA